MTKTTIFLVLERGSEFIDNSCHLVSDVCGEKEKRSWKNEFFGTKTGPV